MSTNDLFKYALLLFLFVTIISLYTLSQRVLNDKTQNLTTKKTIVFNQATKIIAEIADTETKRNQGLSGKEKLKINEGMLFIFTAPGIYSFWMKDMKFNLDFIWMNGNVVVDITQNVSHNNQQIIYSPKVPINMMLEVDAGFVEKEGIKAGSKIKIINN